MLKNKISGIFLILSQKFNLFYPGLKLQTNAAIEIYYIATKKCGSGKKYNIKIVNLHFHFEFWKNIFDQDVFNGEMMKVKSFLSLHADTCLFEWCKTMYLKQADSTLPFGRQKKMHDFLAQTSHVLM